MPSKKILELIETLSKDAHGQEMSELLLRFSNIDNDPKKISESLIMLFSIIDTNNKKNKHIMIEILTVLLMMREEKQTVKEKENQPKTNKSTQQKSLKTYIGEAILKAPVLFVGGGFIITLIVLFFVFYKVDPKATDKAVDSVKTITTKPLKEAIKTK